MSDATHNKLYLIMDFYPLHEPGQGNQGLRACNGYRYEFHIAKGASLDEVMAYRVEFTNTLIPEAAPGANDPLGGGNELLWQLTGGTETMKVSRIVNGKSHQPAVIGNNLKVLRQSLYLHSSPMYDVSNFGADILYPVLVRDLDAMGLYAALNIPAPTVATLKGPRLDIIKAINLGRPIPIEDGYTADVITLDAATDSKFPNGRRLGGGPQPNMNQVNVNTVLISLIAAGDPNAGLARGVEVNDKNYLPRFPFLAIAHQGLLQGHGGLNVPTVIDPAVP